MGWNWFTGRVENVVPKDPILFTGSKGQASFAEIIKASAPEFSHGATAYFNPLLPSGHLHTAYTALNDFDGSDHVHYKRRILTIEDKTYQVGSQKLKYDAWKGASTIAIDYVVPEEGFDDPDHEKYRPASQTGTLFPRTQYLNPEKEHDILKDESKPLLIALHGLAGGSYESYIRSQISAISPAFDVLVLNARGCANHTITSPQLFNGLWTNDLRYVINEHVRVKWPNKRIYLIGFSLGGAIVANYIGQEGASVDPMIKTAVIVGSPWNFTDSSLVLKESIIGTKIYSYTMGQNLVKLLAKHTQSMKEHTVIDEFLKAPENYKVGSLTEFDDFFTSRLFGFNNANAYYRHASPDQRLYKVRVPTIIINSVDDPIIGNRTLPSSEVTLNPYTFMITTTIGGHLGWFKLNGQRWNVGPIASLLGELDANWTVDKASVSDETLPKSLDQTWQYDRIVMGMLPEKPEKLSK